MTVNDLRSALALLRSFLAEQNAALAEDELFTGPAEGYVKSIILK